MSGGVDVLCSCSHCIVVSELVYRGYLLLVCPHHGVNISDLLSCQQTGIGCYVNSIGGGHIFSHYHNGLE